MTIGMYIGDVASVDIQELESLIKEINSWKNQ